MSCSDSPYKEHSTIGYLFKIYLTNFQAASRREPALTSKETSALGIGHHCVLNFMITASITPKNLSDIQADYNYRTVMKRALHHRFCSLYQQL